MNLAMKYEEFIDKHRNKLHESYSREIWNQVINIDLDTAIIFCGFSGYEQVVVRLDRFGKTHWESNYSVIGIGMDIALAFLCQRDWHDEEGKPLQLMDCLYRLFEAKRAAEKNRHVGEATAFQVLFPSGERFDISDVCFELFKKQYDERLILPRVAFSDKYLEPIEDDDESSQSADTDDA
jgi:hypothetical protein